MGGSCLLIRSLGPGVFQPVIAAVVPQEQGALGFELLVQLKAEGVGECGAVADAGAPPATTKGATVRQNSSSRPVAARPLRGAHR